MSKRKLTTPDLVVLTLLTERPMHGYQLNLELERRDVRDWAGISRPQVYYSLIKLEAEGLITPMKDGRPAAGPEKRSYRTTPSGAKALEHALEREHWSEQRSIPPFLTWMALSGRATVAAVRGQIERRRAFLLRELSRERRTMDALMAESGPMIVAARCMVDLTIQHFETELRWLDKVARVLPAGRTAIRKEKKWNTGMPLGVCWGR